MPILYRYSATPMKNGGMLSPIKGIQKNEKRPLKNSCIIVTRRLSTLWAKIPMSITSPAIAKAPNKVRISPFEKSKLPDFLPEIRISPIKAKIIPSQQAKRVAF